MALVWYFILLFILIVYVILDGYDFGAGIVHLLFAKKESDKKAITSAIGPFWDANEVWLIAGGGVLFFAFPLLYASAFSGFYLPLIIILWLLIFRAIGLELRSQIKHSMWHLIWDKAFGVSSLLLALFFGIALGNVLRGVNLGGVIEGVSKYEAQYFFLPLWNENFSPLVPSLGIIDWFTLPIGLISVIALFVHGANWIIFKTNSTMNDQLKSIVYKSNYFLIALLLIVLCLWQLLPENPLKNFINIKWLWIFPIITLIGIIGLFWVRSYKKSGTGFIFSSLFLFGGMSSAATTIFPNLLPSTNSINPSLSYLNTCNTEYALSTGLIWFPIGLILIIIYFIFQYKIFNGKMDDIDYHH